VKDDKFSAEAFGEIDRFEGMPDCAVAFRGAISGKLVAIRGGAGDFGRERTEIVQGGNLHFARLEHLQNALHEGKSDAMAEFHGVETEVEDFLDHRGAIRVASGVPTSGAAYHSVSRETIAGGILRNLSLSNSYSDKRS
jgi:hypothetical protein